MSNNHTNTLSLSITSLFSLRAGRTQPSNSTGTSTGYWQLYDTLIIGTAGVLWPAEIRHWLGFGDQQLLPDNSVVFATGQLRWFPATWAGTNDDGTPRPSFPQKAFIDVLTWDVFGGDPTSDEYDIIPGPAAVIDVLGHVRSGLQPVAQGLDGFRIHTTNYVNNQVAQQQVHCAFDRTSARWRNTPAPHPNSCVNVKGSLHFIHTDGTPGLRVGHISFGLAPAPPSSAAAQGPPSGGSGPGSSSSKKRRLMNALPWEEDNSATMSTPTRNAASSVASTSGTTPAVATPSTSSGPSTQLPFSPPDFSMPAVSDATSVSSPFNMASNPALPSTPQRPVQPHYNPVATLPQQAGPVSLPPITTLNGMGFLDPMGGGNDHTNAAVPYNPLRAIDYDTVSTLGSSTPTPQPTTPIAAAPSPFTFRHHNVPVPGQLPASTPLRQITGALPPIAYPALPGDLPGASAKAKGKRPSRK